MKTRCSLTVLTLALVAALAWTPAIYAEVVLTASVDDDQGVFAHPFTYVSDFWPKDIPSNMKQKHPFLEYHCFFNAFGANDATRSQHELYDETTPYPYYQFDRLTDHIDTVITAGLKPYLTLGNCPIDLASNPEMGFYNTTIHGPASNKWETYRDFVTAFFDDLDTKYGSAEVATWRFRFMTEQDNTQWWVDGAAEWFKFYDYTVSGARRANPDVRISPGNLMRHYPGSYGTWLVPFANRVQNDIFSIAGEHTYKPDRITFSLYSPWRVNQQDGPEVLGTDTSAIRAALAPYSMFDNIPLGIDEGYVGQDENGKTLWARVDGTEWGASHFAYLAQQMIDENWDVGSLWDPGDPDCPQPMRNVLELLDTMDDLTRIAIPVTSGTPPSSNEVAALAATDGGTTKVMLTNYHYWRTSSTPTDYRIRLTDLAPGYYDVSENRIDANHGNYRTQWLIDSAGYTRTGDNSKYDMYPLAGLQGNQAAINLWNANYTNYQSLANDMDMGTTTYAVGDSGILEIVVQMPAHSVSFFDVVKQDIAPLTPNFDQSFINLGVTPGVYDGNGEPGFVPNGMLDADEQALLETILANDTLAIHDDVLAAWIHNYDLLTVETDLNLDGNSDIGLDWVKLLAGYITLGDAGSFDIASGAVGILLPGTTLSNGYDLSQESVLAADGDADGDGVSNIAEYSYVPGLTKPRTVYIAHALNTNYHSDSSLDFSFDACVARLGIAYEDFNGGWANNWFVPNNMIDADEFALIQAIMDDPTHPANTAVTAAWESNLEQMCADVGYYTASEWLVVLAAYMTLGDADCIKTADQLLAISLQYIDEQDYDVTQEDVLSKLGDADSDGITNYDEYTANVGFMLYDRAAYLAAALDDTILRDGTLMPDFVTLYITQWNAPTVNLDGDSIYDFYESYLAQEIMTRDEHALHHGMTTAWVTNIAQATTDLSPWLTGAALQQWAMYNAGMAMTGDLTTVQLVIDYWSNNQAPAVNPALYDTSGSSYLIPTADPDGDSYDNQTEFANAVSQPWPNYQLYADYALDPALH